MNAEEVIASHGRIPGVKFGMCQGCEWRGTGLLDHSVHILSELKAAGFVVIELPAAPNDVTTATDDEHGWRTWFTEYGTVQVSDSGCVAIDRMYRFSDLPEEPRHLRAVAAALLAAAEAVEGGKTNE